MKNRYLALFSLLLSISTLSFAKTSDNWSGDHYKENSSMQQESATTLIENIPFEGNELVLDVGCGDGKITAQIAQKIPNGYAVGFDISENMITTAQQIHSNIPNISFHKADAQSFTLKQTFDYIFSFYALHWAKDMVKTFINIKKVLKQNGTLFVKIATMHKTCPIQIFFNNIDPNGKWKEAKKGRAQTFYGPQTVQEFETVLENAGFQNKQVELVYESFYFENFDNLVNWFMGWIPYCIRLSDETSLEFCKNMVTDLYNKESKKHTDHFVFTFPIFCVQAS